MKFIRYQTNPTCHSSLTVPSLRQEMDRLFDVAFSTARVANRTDFPVDLFEGKDAFTLRAELPGFRKEDLSIDLENDTLIVSGQQKFAEATETITAVPERRISRAVSLPENLDLEKVQAAYENGVLSITLPKREETKPRQIAVEIK